MSYSLGEVIDDYMPFDTNPNDATVEPMDDSSDRGSDVDDPANMLEAHETDPLRLASGALTFIQNILDTIAVAGEGDYPQPKAGTLAPMPVKPIGSDTWRGSNMLVTAEGQEIVRTAKDRRRVVVTNYGPNTVYLSIATPMNGASPPPSPNEVRLLAVDATTGFFCDKEFFTSDRIWARTLTAQTAVVDIVEEFDRC